MIAKEVLELMGLGPITPEFRREIKAWRIQQGPIKGFPCTEEQKRKIGLSKKGIPLTEEHKRNLSLSKLGKHHSKRRVYKPQSPEHIKNRALALRESWRRRKKCPQ